MSPAPSSPSSGISKIYRRKVNKVLATFFHRAFLSFGQARSQEEVCTYVVNKLWLFDFPPISLPSLLFCRCLLKLFLLIRYRFPSRNPSKGLFLLAAPKRVLTLTHCWLQSRLLLLKHFETRVELITKPLVLRKETTWWQGKKDKLCWAKCLPSLDIPAPPSPLRSFLLPPWLLPERLHPHSASCQT